MSSFTFFMTLGLISIANNITLSTIIVGRLQDRGEKINWIFIRALFPKYVHKYKNLVKEESGRVPFIYYAWLFTINAALVICISGFVVR